MKYFSQEPPGHKSSDLHKSFLNHGPRGSDGATIGEKFTLKKISKTSWPISIKLYVN
jgi:hypothetical protein